MKAFHITYFLIIFLIVCCSKEHNDSMEIETKLEKPGIVTAEVEEIYSNYVMAYGNILRLGEYEILNHGFIIAEHDEPTINDNIISYGPTLHTGRYGGRIANLNPNTDYYLCAFLEYEIDSIMYGNTKSFKTLETNTWIEKSVFQGSYLTGAVSFVIGNKLYVGTGIHDQYMNSFYEYNYKTDSWRRISRFPADPRSNAIAFSCNGYAYVGLGMSCIGDGLCVPYDYNDLWQYNPQDDNWSRMSYFPGSARYNSTCFVIGNKAYITGSSYISDYDLWEYNTITNQWTSKADYPGYCNSRMISFALDGKGYVGFGWSDNTCNDFWEYDPTLDEWTEKASFPGTPRYNSCAYSYKNRGIIVCGTYQDFQTQEYLDELWEYNHQNDSWTKLNTIYPGVGRVDMIMGIVNNRIFIGLGATNIASGPYERYEDFWEYIPELN